MKLMKKKKRALMENEMIHYPPDTRKSAEMHADGAKLSSYSRKNVEVRHVFARGVQKLEDEAEHFFDVMQSEIDMALAPLSGSRKSKMSSKCLQS